MKINKNLSTSTKVFCSTWNLNINFTPLWYTQEIEKYKFKITNKLKWRTLNWSPEILHELTYGEKLKKTNSASRDSLLTNERQSN